jgi:LysR family transcriptional regulator, regulator for bpeEF and oprC
MDRLRSIEYFVCAAELGSISGAADVLGVSPPAVSKLLAALESRLRISLFTRTSRGVVLTRDGEGYLIRCRKILDDLESAEAALAVPVQSPRGTLVVGMPPNLATYCVAPALNKFRARFPEILIQLRRAYRDSDLAAQRLDVLVAVAWLGRDDLIATRLAQSRFLICAAPTYWARAGTPQSPTDLTQHDCLVYRIPEAIPLDTWTFARDKERCAVQLKPKTICDEQGWLIADALNGGGVVRAIDLTVRPYVERGELVPVLLDWQACEAPPIHVIYRKVQRRNERVRAFVQFVRELFVELESERLPRAGSAPQNTQTPEWWGRRPIRSARYLNGVP